MADDLDLSTILRSPLDEPDPPGAWWPVLAGIAIGALAVIAGYAVASSGDEPSGSPAATTAVHQQAVGVAASDIAFPPGYQPLSETVAARPEHAMRVGDELFITVATVYRRGFFVEAGSLDGGAWVLETDTGLTLASTGVVTNPGVTGVVTVVFPDPGDAGLAQLRFVERWEPDGRDGSTTVALDAGALGVTDDVATVDLGGGVRLDITRVELTERGGSVDWALSGSELGGDVVVLVRAVQDAQDLGFYFPTGGVFFGQRVVRPGTSGTIALSRDQAGSADVGGATELVIEVSATLLRAFPADAVFDVTDLPVATS
jgi:hypothetical protein